MVVENYDVKDTLFEPKEQVLDLKYIYILIKKYRSEVTKKCL